MTETIFHKIINREVPADILYEDDRAIAIADIAPVSDTHILIIPKQTLPSLREAQEGDEALLGHLMLVAAIPVPIVLLGLKLVSNFGGIGDLGEYGDYTDLLRLLTAMLIYGSILIFI